LVSSSRKNRIKKRARQDSLGSTAPDARKLGALRVDRRTFIKGTVAAAALGVVAVGINPQEISEGSSAPEQFTPAEILEPGAKRLITLNVNGQNYAAEVEARDMLVNVLRENLGLIGTKRPCNRMECGGCTVVIDEKPYYSCTYLAIRAVGKKILTVEGRDHDPVIKALQDAWHESDASQCGYCQPGQIMSATALLKSNPNPTLDEIKQAMSGNLCRCGTYRNIIEATQLASKNLRGVA
jgi:aerobic-type carbon monoxide dehydrogenase small subunit (CoxS/CutS family)